MVMRDIEGKALREKGDWTGWWRSFNYEGWNEAKLALARRL